MRSEEARWLHAKIQAEHMTVNPFLAQPTNDTNAQTQAKTRNKRK